MEVEVASVEVKKAKAIKAQVEEILLLMAMVASTIKVKLLAAVQEVATLVAVAEEKQMLARIISLLLRDKDIMIGNKIVIFKVK